MPRGTGTLIRMGSNRFGLLLGECLARTDQSQNRFAKELGVSQGLVSRVLAGLRRPPLAAVERWILAATADPAEREALRWAAHLDQASPWLRAQVDRLRQAGDGDPATGRRAAESRTRYRTDHGPDAGG